MRENHLNPSIGSLSFLIKYLGIKAEETDESEDVKLVKHLAAIALTSIQENFKDEAIRYAPFVRLREKYERLAKVPVKNQGTNMQEEPASIDRYHQMKQETITARRKELAQLRSRNVYSEELIRRKEFELDLEQMSMTLPN